MEKIIFKEREFYRENIIEMVHEMQNHHILKLIYYFTLSGYKEEKAGRA